jgi:hypothetical protein
VIKVGSALLVGKDGQPRREWLAALVAEIAAARARGQDVIVVSSGAIALGARRLGLAKGGRGALPMRRPPPRSGRLRWRASGPNCWPPMASLPRRFC